MRDLVGRQASGLTRSRARSFYLASLFLPRAVRRDVHVVYAYYRTIDDLVDEPTPGWSRARISEELQWWEDGLFGGHESSHALLREIRLVADTYAIPPRLLALVVQGARFDLEFRVPETMEDLINYSILVAGSVGMVMAHVLGARDDGAIDAARELGVAMQLTNVLRDISEDVGMGRVYLPREEMRRANCDPRAVQEGTPSEELKVVIRAITCEARRRYALGEIGIAALDPSVRFSIALAARLYAGILDKIERQDFDVFAGRAHLGTFEKWARVMPAYLHYRYAGRR